MPSISYQTILVWMFLARAALALHSLPALPWDAYAWRLIYLEGHALERLIRLGLEAQFDFCIWHGSLYVLAALAAY